MPPSADEQLSDRDTADRGVVFMTGIPSLARLPIKQLRIDRAAVLQTAAFVSAIPGQRWAATTRQSRRGAGSRLSRDRAVDVQVEVIVDAMR